MKRVLILFLFVALAFGQAVLSVTKTPYEEFDCSMDFAAVIGMNGMTLDTVKANLGDTDTTSSIIASSPIPAIVGSTQTVAFRVKGGANGETHRIGVRVVDATTGEKYEGVMLLRILLK